MNGQLRVMRDVFIDRIYDKMHEDKRLFFLSADFGSPALDRLRERFKDRFINVGIAEQNLINVSAGLALEGFIVYAYTIAPFLTMRAYEQCRNNLSLLSHTRQMNINLVGVGAGLSYNLSGPTHHCMEDIVLMKLLPNFTVFSPSDWKLAESYADLTVDIKKPKYIRLDAKPLPPIYDKIDKKDLKRGFQEIINGRDVCLVATGYMTHAALKAAKALRVDKISCGVLDIFLLKPLDEEGVFNVLKKYKCIVTMEEAFINSGGLDTSILHILSKRRSSAIFANIGFDDRYTFELGGRDYLHRLKGLDVPGIIKTVKKCLG